MNAHLILISMGLAGVMAGTGPCGLWAQGGGTCKAGTMRDKDDGHQCQDNTCSEAECCAFYCRDHFEGSCGAKEQLNKHGRMYGSSITGKVNQASNEVEYKQFVNKIIDWNLVGAGVMHGCCQTTCLSANMATCPTVGGKAQVLKRKGCLKTPSGMLWNACNETGEVTKHGEKFEGCCEVKTCAYDTCDVLDFDRECKNVVPGKCKDSCEPTPTTKEKWEQCAACVNVPAAHAQCVACVTCYGGLKLNEGNTGTKIVVTPPAVIVAGGKATSLATSIAGPSVVSLMAAIVFAASS